MKLLTHNFLQCHIKGVKNGYPLKIEAVKIDERDADFDPGQKVQLQQAVTAAHWQHLCGVSSKLLSFGDAMQTSLDQCSSV
jgi:multifunctional methyltransferase subunit TRM112